MEKTKQQTTINSIIEDRYVWTCLSPIALQLNFLKKLFPKIQGNASLCKRNNGDSPLIIIPINGHRFEDKIIPCIYRYESSDGKKNDLTVNAYFPHNPYLQRIAIMAWETEGVSIEKITDVLGEMSCETVPWMPRSAPCFEERSICLTALLKPSMEFSSPVRKPSFWSSSLMRKVISLSDFSAAASFSALPL